MSQKHTTKTKLAIEAAYKDARDCLLLAFSLRAALNGSSNGVDWLYERERVRLLLLKAGETISTDALREYSGSSYLQNHEAAIRLLAYIIQVAEVAVRPLIKNGNLDRKAIARAVNGNARRSTLEPLSRARGEEWLRALADERLKLLELSETRTVRTQAIDGAVSQTTRKLTVESQPATNNKPLPDGTISGAKIMLRGTPFRLTNGLRQLLAYLITHTGARDEAVCMHMGWDATGGHLHKRLKDLRDKLKKDLKQESFIIHIRTEETCVYCQLRDK